MIFWYMGRLGNNSYTTSGGVHQDSFHSAIGRLGIVLGKKQKEGDHPHDFYLKASVHHEFGGDRAYHLSSLNRYGDVDSYSGSSSYKDTWWEIGLGGNLKISKSTMFYADVETGVDGDYRKEWQFNAGLSWSY